MTQEKADTNIELEIARSDQGRTRLAERPLAELAPGEIRFRVERFALTANNVTYAVIGDLFGYWDFFPTEAGWGRVPAMGWGEIVASAHPQVSVGSRHYGWFPMSRYAQMTVSPVAEGVRDDSPHRAAHAPVYRAYTATDRDAFYESGADAEDRHALLRGLFLTAFLADDFFADHAYHGAGRVVVLSASSKTAIGFAQRAAGRGGLEVIGLTSPGNADFVRGLGWYDRVVTYDDLESIPATADTVSIDMAGNGPLLARLHAHLGGRLRYSMTVGLSHHDAARDTPPASGPTPELFFAPTQVSKRMEDWGPDGFRQRVAAALHDFVAASRRWLTVQRSHGPAAARESWDAVRDGGVPPSEGRIVSLWPER
jgi:Protein of unknown function (DUF2855)